jgi:hypothetical protein
MHRACAAQSCDTPASERCFECGVWLCQTHLVHISLPTYEGRFAETVCSACLQLHLDTPDPYGVIAIDSPTSLAAAGA